MFIVWVLLGALVAWPVFGALIGIAAALLRGFPVGGGIILGVILGPMALVLFFGNAEDMTAPSNFNAMTVVDKRLSSRFVIRRCPECTGPNASLTYQGTTSNRALEEPAGAFVLWGHFVPPARRQDAFTHRYKCIVCGYEWQFESPHVDPDKALIRDF